MSSWEVEYSDGSFLTEHGEQVTPMSAIEWSRVVRVYFASAQAQVTIELPDPSMVVPNQPNLAWSLRARHFLTMSGETLRCLMLVLSDVGQPVDERSTKLAYYWLPDGTEHTSPLFDSPDVRRYAAGLLHGLRPSLMPFHSQLTVRASIATAGAAPDL